MGLKKISHVKCLKILIHPSIVALIEGIMTDLYRLLGAFLPFSATL